MWTIFTALGGGASPHSASTSASTDTVRSASSSSRASSARSFCPPAATTAPLRSTPSGPSRRYSVLWLATIRPSHDSGHETRGLPRVRGAGSRTDGVGPPLAGYERGRDQGGTDAACPPSVAGRRA